MASINQASGLGLFGRSHFIYATFVGNLELSVHRILTAEMVWLRKLAGVSRRQRKKHEDIRLDLNHMETLARKI